MDAVLIENRCMVPWEILEEPVLAKVSLFGVKGDKIITTDICSFSLKSTLERGSSGKDPTPDAYQQIINMIEAGKVKGPQGDPGPQGPRGETGQTGPQGPRGETGQRGPQGEIGQTGQTGPAGQDGHTPVKGVDYWTASDKQEIYAEAEQALRDQEQSSVAAIREAGADEVEKVQIKGTEVLESIPEDYSALTAEVSGLKSDLSNLDSAVFGETVETDVTGEVLNGVIIDTRKGTESTKFPYSKCTGFIDVSDNADYYYTGKIYNYIGIAGYNSNGEFIASVLSDTNENFTDCKLVIPDGVEKIRASSYSPSESVTNPLQVVKKVKTSNLVDEVLTLNKMKENITKINHIYVATTGSDEIGDGSEENPFATIYHANETIADANESNQYIIHVADGTYTDLQERYAGVLIHGNYEGIKCKPWVIYEGNPKHPENVVIQWDGKTGYGDEFNYNDHAVHFCPFHITGSNGWTVGHKEIRGFTFDCKNTRYALHVEMSGYGYGVTWKVSDCVFIWHGIPDCSDITYQIPAVGTGSGHYEKGHLLRCKIINDSGVTDGFRNHDSKWVYGSLLGNLPHIGAEIIIEDCVFNAGDSGDTNATFRTTNGNGLVDGYNRFSIINCVGINKLNYQLSGGSTECEWRANIKCSKIVTNQFLSEGLLQ